MQSRIQVDKKDLPVLAEALQIPPSFKLNQGSIVDGMEGLCMPKTYFDSLDLTEVHVASVILT